MSTQPQSRPGLAVANGSIAATEAGAIHPADQLTWFDDFASGDAGLGSAVCHPRTGPAALTHAGAELEHRTAELESANRELAAAVRLAEDARAEVAAVEAEQRALIEAMRDVILVLDGDGRYVKVPPTAPDLLYRPSQDLVGRLMHEVMPAETADRFLAVIRQALHTRDAVRVEYDLPIAGRTVWFSGVVSPMSADQVVWVSRDITAQREAEAAALETTDVLRAIVDESPLAHVSVDLDLRITRWNAAAEQLLGWTSAEIVGAPLRTIIPADQVEQHCAIHEEALNSGSVRTVDTRRLRKDGSMVDVNVSVAAIHDAQGNINSFAAIFIDTTEQKQLEARLLQSQKMEAVGQLAGGIAHDFNNLLTAITSYTHILLDGVAATDERHNDLLEISNAADRAASLTRQLLTFSRQQVVQPRVLSLNAVVLDLEKMLRRLVREDIDFRVIPDPTLGAVRVDRGQMEQVVLNLVVNARDAMPDGGAVMIETSNVELTRNSIERSQQPSLAPGSYVLLSVTDTGTGMTAATQARIFEPFFSTKPPGRGTGLGLATAYGIVNQANGHISVYSEPGHGSRFKVLLPRVQGPGAASPIETPGSTKLPRGTETILLVEDDDAVRAVAYRILARQGYQILEARSGNEALTFIGRRPVAIDIVVTDMVMPGMSGPELAGRVRQRCPEMRVLFMSGYSRDAARQITEFASGTAYLEKPFSPQRLATRVRELLDMAPVSHEENR